MALAARPDPRLRPAVKEKVVIDARKRYDELMRDLINPPPRVEPQLAAE